jgi:hypothetical protein
MYHHPFTPPPTLMYPFLPSSPIPCSIPCTPQPSTRGTYVASVSFLDFFSQKLKTISLKPKMHTLTIHVASHISLNPAPEAPVYTLQGFLHLFLFSQKTTTTYQTCILFILHVASYISLNPAPGPLCILCKIFPHFFLFSQKPLQPTKHVYLDSGKIENA